MCAFWAAAVELQGVARRPRPRAEATGGRGEPAALVGCAVVRRVAGGSDRLQVRECGVWQLLECSGNGRDEAGHLWGFLGVLV